MDGWMDGWIYRMMEVCELFLLLHCLVTSLLQYFAVLLPRFLSGSLAGCLIASPFCCFVSSKCVS